MESLKKVKTILSSQALQKQEESYSGPTGHSLSIPGFEGLGGGTVTGQHNSTAK